MKLKTLKAKPQATLYNDRALNIVAYGDSNDLPQKINNLIQRSDTGSECVRIYKKFIYGAGFLDLNFCFFELNRRKETADTILRKVSEDFAKYGGFALHINYNAFFKIVEIQHVPFEHVRLSTYNANGYIDHYCLHDDWAKEQLSLHPFNAKDIILIDKYNPTPEVILSQVQRSGGWQKYNGQLLYYTGTETDTYPLPTYLPALTDMATEEALSNIAYRSAKNRFMVGGIIVEIKRDNQNTDNEEEESNLQQQLLQLQGDEQACKLAYASVERKEDIPELLTLETKNFDKDYEATQKSVRERIGVAFNQPPILRSEHVATGFDTSAMESAFKYYNLMTQDERNAIESIFFDLMTQWKEEININDFSIKPLQWQ